MRRDKGIVGLNIVLSAVIILFMIGFVLTIYGIAGGRLEEEGWNPVSGSATNESLASIDETGGELAASTSYNNPVCTILSIQNESVEGVNNDSGINSANYTTDPTGCKIYVAATGVNYNTSNWNVSYSYTAEANSTDSGAIESATDAPMSVTDWYSLIIILTIMVVLILLTVIIISAIRGTGMIRIGGGGGSAIKDTA